MLKSNNLNQKKGLTLIEVLLAIVIGVIVLGTAYVIYSKVSHNTHISKATSRASLMISGIQSLYSGSSNYSNVSTKVLINSNIAPKAMISGSKVYHNLGNGSNPSATTVTLQPVNGGRQFELIYHAVPQASCTKFASRMASSVDNIKFGGSGSGVINKNGSVSVSKISKNCSSGGNTIDLIAH